MQPETGDADQIRARPVPDCALCGQPGVPLYRELADRLFDAPGRWDISRCPSPACGLLWLDPMPVEEDIARAYRSYYTHAPAAARSLPHRARERLRHAAQTGYLASRYGGAGSRWWQRLLGRIAALHPGWRAAADFAGMYLPVRPGGRLLDVGCGRGDALAALHDCGWSVHGVDIDDSAARVARSCGFDAQTGTVADRHFPDGHFDAIVMSHVIEHVHDPVGLLRECRRILKSDGWLVAVTPNARSLGHRIFGGAWRALDPPRHLHLFNRPTLDRIARAAGFPDPSVTTTVLYADEQFLASRRIRRAGRTVFGRREGVLRRLWAMRLQMTEWSALRVRPDAGEDVVLRARRE